MITTLDLPKEIIDQAEGVATARKTTLQALVVEGLRTVIRSSDAQGSSHGALERLRAGFHLGGKPLTRSEANAR